jgi:hypothetical protein
LKIVGQIRFKRNNFFFGRVFKTDRRSMQEKSGAPLTIVPGGFPPGIEIVGHDGMSQIFEMDSDLVSSASFGEKLN